jgi:hypothetical protein
MFRTDVIRKALGLPPRIKRASVYRLEGRVLLCPASQTTAGIWIAGAPVVAGASDPAELGRQLIDVLKASKTGVAHPAVWTGQFDPVLRAAGVRSLAAFMQSAVGVDVAWSPAGIALTPCRNLGRTQGFEHDTDKATLLPDFTDERLGAALLSAFDNAS